MNILRVQNSRAIAEGQYYAGKGNLSITYEGNDEFLIEVWWGISADDVPMTR